jgi:ElaB/YqjD/DUF883 family membrane-anchored ribosome-binding protein
MNNPSEHGSTHREQGRPDMGRGSESSSTMGTVKDKARDVASGAAELAGQAKEKVQEWGSTIASGAQHAWDATSRQTRELASDVAERAENAWEGLGNTIRRYPVASVLIAAGVGFILGGGLGVSARRSS